MVNKLEAWDYFEIRNMNPGLYEYLISRTKCIDETFKNLTANIEQVLIFGAGFDFPCCSF
jgi:O-methyltransferase involved in polyketide biosynthesis